LGDPVMDASFLREKAQHCRNMAKIAIIPELQDELLAFDSKAASLDMAMGGNKPFVKDASDKMDE
jgi:hypothetical protein